eukprot:m.80886 g.80886  ORF g.80886 m.80886 type:complete len:1253 (-) comp12618_c0_seq2:422-4180(-)
METHQILVGMIDKILTKDQAAPKTKHLHRLVAAIKTTEDVDAFFVALTHTDMQTQHIIWKALGLVHLVFVTASSDLVQHIATKHREAIVFLESVCDHQTSLYAKASGTLAQLLLRKLDFHQSFVEFGGNFTLTMTPEALLCNHTPSTLLSSLLDMQQLYIVCATVVFSLERSIPNRSHRLKIRQDGAKIRECLLWPLLQVMSETVFLYEASLQLLDRATKQGVSADAYIRLFQTQHRKLSSMYQQARSTPFLSTRLITLSLGNPPDFYSDAKVPIPARIQPIISLEGSGYDSGDASSAAPSPPVGRRELPGATSRSTSSSSPSYPSDVATLRAQLTKLKDDAEVDKGRIASLEHMVQELASTLTLVDPDAVARLQLDALQTQCTGHGELTYDELQTAYAAAQADLDRVQMELDVLQEGAGLEMQTAQDHIRDLEQDATESRANLDVSRVELASMQDVVEDQRAHLEVLEEEVFKEVQRATALEQELQATQGLLDDERVAHNTTMTELTNLQEQLTQTLTESREIVDSLTEDCDQQQQLISDLTHEKASFAQRIDALEAENQTLQHAIQDLTNEAGRAAQQRKDYEEALQQLEEKLEDSTKSSIACMERELVAHEELQTVKTALSEAQQSIVVLQSSLRVQEEDAASKTRQCAVLEELLDKQKVATKQEVANLNAQLESERERLSSAQSQDEFNTQQTLALKAQIQTLQATVASLEEQRSVSQKQQRQSDATLQQVNLELSTMTQLRQAEEASHAAQVTEFKAEINRLNKACKDAELHRNEKEKQAAALANELSSMKMKLSTTEKAHQAEQQTLEDRLLKQQQEVQSLKAEKAQVVCEHTEHVAHLKRQHSTQLQAVRTQLGVAERARDAQVARVSTSINNTLSSVTKTCLHALKAGDALEAALSRLDPVLQAQSHASDPSTVVVPLLETCMMACFGGALVLDEDGAKTGEPTQMLQASLVSTVNQIANSIVQDKPQDAVGRAEMLSRLLNQLIILREEKQAAALKQAGLLESQMQEAGQVVSDAAQRIQAMIASAKDSLHDKYLLVHDSILEPSRELMVLVGKLMQDADVLQQEIVMREVGDGKRPSDLSKFYKKNSRWVDGLVSAAKAVGAAASVLVDTANRILTGHGKYEELMVCGHELSAATAQLVSASRVKANTQSSAKQQLESSSSQVYEYTQQLVEAVRSVIQQSREVQSAEDYLKLTITQARRLEMDAQIRVKELEFALVKEQERLRQLRKAQYQLSSDDAVVLN